MTQGDWFNVFCKTIGLYWFVYGVLTTVEMLYSAFLGNVQQMTVYTPDEQSTTVLWGVSMLVVGLFLILKSRTVTDLAYLLEPVGTVNGKPEVQETDEP